MLKQFFKEFSAESGRKNLAFCARAVFAAFFCLFMFSCGAETTDTSAEGKAQKAADYFAKNFSLFIPDGHSVGVEEYTPGKVDGFDSGRFVIKSPYGDVADAASLRFLLSADGSHLILGAVGPLGADDFGDFAIAGFKTVPDSLAEAGLLLVSENGRIIAANRIMDTRVDYAKRNMDRISLENTPVMGSQDAEVAIVEYSDFQCPYCGQAAFSVRELLDQYDGSVKLVYKQFPLSSHDWAYQASEASLCFHKQGGDEAFRHFHDEVFAAQQEITKENHRERFSLIAQKAGLKPQDVFLCMDSGDMRGNIEKDLNEAKDLLVRGTPTFFVNGRETPLNLLKKAVELSLFSEQ